VTGYRDGFSDRKLSPTQVLTRQCTARSRTHNLLITSPMRPKHYTIKPKILKAITNNKKTAKKQIMTQISIDNSYVEPRLAINFGSSLFYTF